MALPQSTEAFLVSDAVVLSARLLLASAPLTCKGRRNFPGICVYLLRHL